MRNLPTFEEFLFEQYSLNKYNKKVAFITITNDIIQMSRTNTNPPERKLNIECIDELFQHFTLEDDNIDIPDDIPILYYGGFQDKSKSFIKKHIKNESNLYNIPSEIGKSGNKVEFHKLLEKYDWVPKAVYTKESALKGDVGFPLVAKIKDGHSGVGIAKFKTAEELKESKDLYDLYSEYINFKNEFRCMMLHDKCYMVNERVPVIDANKTIDTKKPNEKVEFMYVYTDESNIPIKFKNDIQNIATEIQKHIKLDFWSLDAVMDENKKLWVLETNSQTGLGSPKLVEGYIQIYEDFYNEKFSEEYKKILTKKYVIPAHAEYYPKYKKEIEKALWPMNYKKIIK